MAPPLLNAPSMVRIARNPLSLAFLLAFAACGGSASEPGDGEFDSIPTGKADGGIDPDSDEAKAVLALVNDEQVDLVELDDDARLDARAARNIIAHRNGDDGIVGTDDDDAFDSIAELDDISYVGPRAFGRLLDYAIANGYLEQVQGGAGESMMDVIFSPQPSDATHNLRVAELIDGAQDTIDIAMYSYSNGSVRTALEAAAARGVQIRFLYETAYDDRRLEGDDLQNSRSGRLEAVGIDVRWVNKIMHHKYMIIDGPRADLERAATATIATGSANWSNSAGTRYDENTLFLQGHEELALRMQKEFNYLWQHSRELNANPDLQWELSEASIEDGDIVDGPDTHAYFTSANFRMVGTDTFTRNGGNEVSDALIEAIDGATDSIHVASGHLRHRGISEALMAKQLSEPDLDIRVYLDAQEYVSPTTHQIQLDDLDDCLEEASTATQTRNCMDRGFRFGYQLGEEAGIDVRYKWYSYRWHYTYAAQMHHKYILIDGDELWTGSYNLSDNAEHNTFENMLMFRGDDYADLVAQYEQNFATMWETGRADGLLGQVRDEIETSDVIPLVFDSMALEHEEVRQLKSLIVDNCPEVNSNDFRRNPQDHLICER